MATPDEWEIVTPAASETEWDIVTPSAQAPAKVSQAPVEQRRGLYDLFVDNYKQASQQGFAGWLARRGMQATEMGLPERFQDLPEEERDALYKDALTTAARTTRQQLADKDAADPTWRSDLSWDRNIDRGAAMLAGQILGGVDPTYIIGGPAWKGVKGVASRVGTQMGLAGLVDAFLQKTDIAEGIADEFDPQRLGLNIAAGAGFQGMLEGVRGLSKLGKVEIDETGRPYVDVPQEDGTVLRQFGAEEEGGLTGGVTDIVKASEEGGEVEARLADEANTFLQKKATGGEGLGGILATNDTPRTMSIDEGVEHINTQTKGWKNAPEFEVHDNADTLPDVDPDAIGAVLPDGKVVINMANVVAEANARRVAPQDILSAATFHEGLGHHGLTQQFREGLDDVLEKMYHSGASSFRRTVDDWMEKNPDAYADDINPFARSIEEVLAEMSENGRIDRTMMDQIKDFLKNAGRKMGFDFKYSDREIRSILSMAHDSVVNGQRWEPTEGGVRHMFVGLNAANSKDPNNPVLMSEEVSDFWDRMEAGENPVDVYRDTGYFVGPDRKTRREISDVGSEFNEYTDGSFLDLPEEEGMRLEDAFHHPVLYNEYPYLRDLTITRQSIPMDWSKSMQGSFDPETNTINITPYAKDPRSTLLHEIQHSIQEYESWVPGGNPEAVVSRMTDKQFRKFRQDFIKESEETYKTELERYNVLEEAYNSKEVERLANDHLAAKELVDSLRDENRHLDFTDPSVMDAYNRTEETTRALRDALVGPGQYSDLPEGKLYGFNTFIHALENGGWSRVNDEINTKANELKSVYDGLVEVANSSDRKFIGQMSRGSRTSFDAYQKIFGELEARDTQERIDLTDAERRELLPYSSGDEFDEADLLLQGGGRGYSADTRYMRRSAGSGSEGQLQGSGARAEGESGTPTAVAKVRSTRNIDEILREATPESTPETWDDWISEAGRKKMTAKMATELATGTDVPTLKAAEIVAVKSANRIKDLQQKIINGTATLKERELFNREVQRLDDISQSIMNVVSNAGRILNSRNIEVSEDKALIDGIRKMIRSNPELLSSPEGAERLAKILDKGQRTSQMYASALRVAANALNLPRSIMSSMDMSAPLRQGIFLVGRKEFWKNIPSMFQQLGKRGFEAVEADILSRPTYGLMKESGLALSKVGDDLAKREEAFMSEWAEKIPEVGKFVQMSERAYTGFLNKLRADTFDDLVSKYNKAGIDLTKNPKALHDIAKYINNATGRGDLGKFTQAAPILNSVFFSPRLIASRVRMLNPATYIQLDPIVRKEAIKSLVSFGSIATTVASLAAMAGADVETDPRSSDFAKIKVGNTRYDILGGFGQYLTLGARLASNEKVTAKGKVQELGKGFGVDTRLDVLEKFFTNKFSPIAGFVRDYLEGKDPVGKKFSAEDSIVNMFIPMFFQDAAELIEEEGAAGIPMSIPGFFGVGMQTYDANSPREDEEPKEEKTKTDTSNEWEIIE